MKLADQYKDILQPYISLKDSNWSFHDRVYAWLSPSSHKDVFEYYQGAKEQLTDLFIPFQLTKIDELAFEELSKRLQSIRKDKGKRYRQPLSLEALLGVAYVHREKKS